MSINEITGYNFKDSFILEAALTHSSVCNKTQAKRLEFLGDAVLSLVVVEELMHKFPKDQERDLATKHNYLVCGDSLYLIAKKINLEKFIKISNEYKKRGAVSKSTLENIMESLIGAMYLDGGMAAVKKFIVKCWGYKINSLSDGKDLLDSKTKLQEFLQSNGSSPPVYSIMKREGLDHDPVFVVSVKARSMEIIAKGKSRKLAEKNAAQIMLDKILPQEN